MRSGLAIIAIALSTICIHQVEAATSTASNGKTYTDSRGHKVHFPLGDISFADAVTSYQIGNPSATDSRFANPNLALGPPNYINETEDRVTPAEVTLGCGGVLTLQFEKAAIIDVPGPDLWIFEVGPSVEATHVEISVDGNSWISVGDAAGGTAGIDIAKFVKPGARYHLVRLTDLKADCGGNWPGADIDAVGAIGSLIDMTFDSSVLFDFNKYTLKLAAVQGLKEAASQLAAYPLARITVEGHTDNVGTEPYNLKLSQARAVAVRSFLLSTKALAGSAIEVVGYGANRPIAPNNTEEGRQRNRRVEIILEPKR